MGRGLVGLNAYKNGKRFVGTELNPKRLAVLLERITDLGGKYQITEGEYYTECTPPGKFILTFLEKGVII